MKYMWSSKLETGNADIDNQHKTLILAFNNLVKASQSGLGRKELVPTIDFLVKYTQQHFSDEEALQLKYHYPKYEFHQKQHHDFTQIVFDICDQLKKEGSTLKLVARVNQEMGNWLVHHILTEDCDLADYIRTYEKSSANHTSSF